MQLDSTIQLGEPVSHRGDRRRPALPAAHAGRRLRDARRGAAARLPRHRGRRGRARARARRPQPARPERAPLRRRGADRRQAEPDPQRDRARRGRLEDARSRSRASRRGAGSAQSAAFGAASHAAHPELRRRKGELLSADPLARGIAQHEVWEAVRESAERHGAHSPTMAQADTYRSREDATRRAARRLPAPAGPVAARCSRSATRSASTTSRSPTRSPASTRSCSTATCSTRSTGSTASRATGSPSSSPRSTAAPRSHGPSAGLGEDVRLASETVLGSGLELDGELIQLCAFTREGRGPQTRIRRPSGRR